MFGYEIETFERYCFSEGRVLDSERSNTISTYGIVALREKLCEVFSFCPEKESVFLGVNILYLAASPTTVNPIIPPRIDGSSGPMNIAVRK